MPFPDSRRAVPPVDSSATPRAASARANSTMPVLSETDSNACVTVPAIRMPEKLDELVLRELRAERVPIEAQHLGRLRLVAVRPLEHRREQRALDVRDDHVVDAVRRLAVEAAEVFVQRMLDAATDLVAAVQSHGFPHAASASESFAAYGRRSDASARRTKNRSTARRCASAASARFTCSRSAAAPGSDALYQCRCFRATRTPTSSP